jgi:nitroreductase
MNILNQVKQRRSHFRKEFTGEKITQEEINYLLECSIHAPSHKNTFPWRYIVFSEDSLRDFSKKIIEIYKQRTPLEMQNPEQIENFEKLPSQVSHLIAIVMKRDEAKRVPEIEEICSVACSVQNMYLGLNDLENVGGFWSTGMFCFTEQMHAFLELGSEDKCMGYFILGKVNQKRQQAPRPDFSTFVQYK